MKMKKRLLSILLSLALVLGQMPGMSLTALADGDAEETVTLAENASLDGANTSRNLAVGQDGVIHIVYRSGDSIFYRKSTNSGSTFSEPVTVATGNECEVAVSSTGRVFVAYVNNGNLYIAYSDNGTSFTPVPLGANSSSLHIAVDGSHVYAIPQAGTTFFYSSDGGQSYASHTGWEGYAFSDVHIDESNHNVVILKDEPAVVCRYSSDYGVTFSDESPVKCGEDQIQVYFSTAAVGKGYVYMAGNNASNGSTDYLYKIDYINATATGTPISACDSSAQNGRSLSADHNDNVVVGYVSNGKACYQVSLNGGETVGSGVEFADASAANAAINTKTGDVLFLYESDGKIMLYKAAGVVPGDSIVYNGELQYLLDSQSEPVCQEEGARYVLGTNDQTAPTEGWGDAIPQGKDAGFYYVWVQSNTTESTCKIVEIVKANTLKTKPKGVDAINHDGAEHALAVAGEAASGKIVYALGESDTQPAETAYSETIPKAAEKGDYTVWYKVVEFDAQNFYADEPQSVKSNIDDYHTLTYAPGAGTGEPYTVMVKDGASTTIPKNKFTAPDEKFFTGWSDGSAVYPAGASYTPTDSVTLTAQWADGYLIPDHGTNTVDLTGKATGYSFVVFDYYGPSENFGSSWDGTLTITPPESKALYIAGTVELTQYEIDSFSISGPSGVLKSFTVPGSVDMGTTESSVSLQLTTNEYGESAPGVSLTVIVVDKATLSFDAGEGTGSMADQDVAVGAPFTLPACTLTAPAGKVFTGWSDGNKVYGAGASYTPTGNATLTAQWTLATTISYELTDKYSDGWNGAAIKVTDKETGNVIATLTVESGSGASGTLEIPAGRTVVFTWVSGVYDNECSYTVKDAEDNVIFSGDGAMAEPNEYRYDTAIPTYTVTYKVVNGTWSDNSTADKTENVQSGSQPAGVPTGMKAASGYTGGAWDTDPAGATITGATTFTYTFTAKTPVSQTVTFKVVNGSWNEGEGEAATADKTVTLSGYEGDTLKLAADQIPAVGDKPNDTYKAGNWDVTPNTTAAITEATTYTYTYSQKNSISQTVTFKVANGKWDDGTTADKTVTLTGYEGDTLKLAADQIPAVGDKPNDTYKAGNWDVTPNTTAAITEATTYTYTYSQKNSISQTVTFKVANGKWDDGTTADKTVTLTGYEGDTLKLTAGQIPAVGDKPNDTYKAGNWDVTPNTTAAITEATTYTYTYAQKDSISQTVTFKVVNGKWDDDSTADKTVTLTGYEGDTLKLAANQIPAVGTKPNDAYKAGSWDVTPSADTAITESTTYTYTYAAKEASVVTKAPEAKTLTYNGSAQELVTAGTATGGEMQYALGTATEATQPYTTSIPTETNAGTYYVWYKAKGDDNHNDTDANYVEVSIGKRGVTLTSATASKAYDGTALTNTNVAVSGDGFVTGEGVNYIVTGTQTLPGNSKNTFDYALKTGTSAGNYKITKTEGTLTVTDRTDEEGDDKKYEITVTANSDEVTYDGTEKSVSGFVQTAFTFNGVTYTVSGLTATAKGTDVGSYTVEVTGTAVVKDSKNNDLTKQFIVSTSNGTLTINKRNVTLTSATASKTYDGNALTDNTVTTSGDGFATGEGATYNVTGSQKVVGSSANAFTYTLNSGTKEANYNITKTEGTLTVTSRDAKYQISPQANSDEVKYDGQSHEVTGFETDTFTVEGNTYTVSGLTAAGSGTDAGSYTVSVSGTAVVKDSDGNDVSDEFAVTPQTGTLTINQRSVTLTSSSDEKEYDGDALTNKEVTVTGDGFAAEEGAAYDVTGSRTLVGTSENTFTYTLNQGTKADNYDIGTSFGTLTVNNRNTKYQVTLLANSGTEKYDGSEKTVSGYTVDGNAGEGTGAEAVTGFTASNGKNYTVTGMSAAATGTNAGEYTVNVIGTPLVKDADGNDVTEQFAVSSESGKLTINKRNVTLTSATDTKVYDGQALTNDEITVSEDGWAEGEGAQYSVTGSQTLAGESANAFTYTLKEGTSADNYQITKSEGTLSVTKADPSGGITAVTDLVYDGEEKALVTAGETDGGSFMYRLGDDGEWQNDIPQAVDAGTYTTYYYIKGDENHKDDGSETEPKGSVETVIAKAAQGKPAENLTTEKASDEVRADGKISGFDVSKTYQYSADGGKTWKDVSGKTVNIKAGTYLIRYAEDQSHLAGSPVSVTVEADPVAQITKEEEDTLTINAGLKVTQKGSKIKVKWGKVKDADGYEIYLEYCGKTRFGSRPEKEVKSGKTSVTIKSIHGKKLNLKKNFKLYVRAYKNVNGKKVTLAKTIAAHVVGRKNKKNTNAKSITIEQPQVVLSVGATHVIKAKTNLVDKKKKQLGNSHAAEFRYASSNENIASVDAKGTVTAKRKGTCIIYVYSRNGLAKTVTVTVQ